LSLPHSLQAAAATDGVTIVSLFSISSSLLGRRRRSSLNARKNQLGKSGRDGRHHGVAAARR
jgi:hypothetical protein